MLLLVDLVLKKENEEEIRKALSAFAQKKYEENKAVWNSKISYDCQLNESLVTLDLAASLSSMKPFGHGFEEPSFEIVAKIKEVRFYNDKQTGEPRHTAVTIEFDDYRKEKVMFFNEVFSELQNLEKARFLVTVSENTFRGRKQLSLFGKDWDYLN